MAILIKLLIALISVGVVIALYDDIVSYVKGLLMPMLPWVI